MKWIFLLIAIITQSLHHAVCQDKIYPYMDSGKIGFKDDKDSILISPEYDFYEPAQAKHGWSVTGQGSYERLNNNASDRAVKFTGKFGFIEVSGKEIFKPQFDMVFKVFEDYAIVGQGEGYLKYNDWPEGKSIAFSGKMGVINIQGSVIVPFNFNNIKLVRSSDLSYWFTLDQHTVLFYSSSTYDTINIPVQGNHNYKLE